MLPAYGPTLASGAAAGAVLPVAALRAHLRAAEALGMHVLFHDIETKLSLGNARASVDLDDLRGAPMTASGLRAGTERMMDAITAIVADLRGETAPDAD